MVKDTQVIFGDYEGWLSLTLSKCWKNKIFTNLKIPNDDSSRDPSTSRLEQAQDRDYFDIYCMTEWQTDFRSFSRTTTPLWVI